MKVKRILYWVTVVFLSAVILVCGTLIAQKLIDDARNQDYYESMSKAVNPYGDGMACPRILAALRINRKRSITLH